MIASGLVNPGTSAGRMIKITVYTFFVLSLQAHLIPRLPYPALRIDLLLPLMFAVAVEWSPLAGLLWASLWGFVVDNFSGEFWGLHVGSYAVTVCLVNLASDRFDRRNPGYQMGLVGLCAAGQSIVLGLFLSFVPMDFPSLTSIWISLGIRTLFSVTVAPFLIYPLLNPRNEF
ncbi:MAG: rod shape-determining protein MreD [Syntrophobacteraceae bacterium]|jgi:rod shape-determining protein MreD